MSLYNVILMHACLVEIEYLYEIVEFEAEICQDCGIIISNCLVLASFVNVDFKLL